VQASTGASQIAGGVALAPLGLALALPETRQAVGGSRVHAVHFFVDLIFAPI